MEEFDAARFPVIAEALRTLQQILLVSPKLADAAVIFAQTFREFVSLLKWWLILKALEWIAPPR
jgi:hypothetical protein